MSTQRNPGMNSAVSPDHIVSMATPSTSKHGNSGSHHGNQPAHGTTRTSTPVTGYRGNTNNMRRDLVNDLNVSPLNVGSDGSTVAHSDTISVGSMSMSTESEHEVLEPGHIAVPILGYEVMEERARFSVFKIQVSRGPDDLFFIFRRYSDFDHLNTKLKEYFPHFRLSLPPKKWFGDNFDKNFLEDRMIGLQAFLNNLVGNKDVCNCEPVREFFCFDDPPGPHDSLEESRALCENLEERVFTLHQQVSEREGRIQLLEEELRLSQIQVENLRKALKLERAAGRRSSLSVLSPTKEEDIQETLPPSDLNQPCPMLKVIRPSTSDTCSISLSSSLNAIETIRMATVTPQPDMDLSSTDSSVQPDVIPRVKKHSGNSSQSSHQVSSGYSSSKLSNQEAVGSFPDGSTSGCFMSDSEGDLTGPGTLCAAAGAQTNSDRLHITSDRVNASSSPRPKHRTTLTSSGPETILPGAHSVDRKRITAKPDTSLINSATGVAPLKDTCVKKLETKSQNNNEALLTM